VPEPSAPPDAGRGAATGPADATAGRHAGRGPGALARLRGGDRDAAARDGPGSAASASSTAGPHGGDRDAAARIQSRRGPKLHPDPERPIAHFRERERRLDGSLAPVLTVLLAGAECPFTCAFCDLWRRTLDGPTPPGAIPRQLKAALRETGPLPATCAAKLYNASNFFDPRAVPPEDDAAIAALLQPFDRVTVECHPRLVAARRRLYPADAETIVAAADVVGLAPHEMRAQLPRLRGEPAPRSPW